MTEFAYNIVVIELGYSTCLSFQRFAFTPLQRSGMPPKKTSETMKKFSPKPQGKKGS